MSNDSSPPWEAKLAEYLARTGLRVTRQRRAIAEAFFTHSGHPNIDELYTSIRAQHPHIGQATVYRTLKLLVESGLAEPSRFGDGTTRYEAADADEHHDHLVCVDCSHIVEFRNDEIERLQEEIAAAHRFRVTDHKMVIYGVCTDAQCPRRRSPSSQRHPDSRRP
ncbi:MAG: transcriptional repressor [Deltaproteobacteria bacterium]|jgi:Fur family ferric uptake transcriptional regulator|nr:transcriptional repressor [Deltaproteobacteria bacterium]